MTPAEGILLTETIVKLILMAKASGVKQKDIDVELKRQEARHAALVTRFKATRTPKKKTAAKPRKVLGGGGVPFSATDPK